MSRLVLVTGASRGIGHAVAEAFCASGDRVVALSRSGGGPEAALLHLAVDVANRDALHDAVRKVIDEFGPIDVAVVNAGVTNDGLALRMSEEQWHSVLRTNLDGAFFTAQAVLGSMVKQRKGSIIFIGSVVGFLGTPGQANYAASKAGLVGLARSLASELARRSITVNVVAPGLIDTDMTQVLGDAREAIVAQIPAGRVGTVTDVANAVHFLASEQARYVTGAVLPVDGGLGMGW